MPRRVQLVPKAGAAFEERERQQGGATPTRASSMLVQPNWVEENLPGLTQVAADELVLSTNKRHGTRSVSALAATPGGSTHPVSTTVSYTLPPPEGERESTAKRRRARHREREQRKLRSLDLSGQGVTYCRVLQDYDPEPLFRPQRERDKSGTMRTDYPLW